MSEVARPRYGARVAGAVRIGREAPEVNAFYRISGACLPRRGRFQYGHWVFRPNLGKEGESNPRLLTENQRS